MDLGLSGNHSECIVIKVRFITDSALQYLFDRSPAYHARARQHSGSEAIPGSQDAVGRIIAGHATDRRLLPGCGCTQSMVHNYWTSTFEYRWLAYHELRFATRISKSSFYKNRQTREPSAGLHTQ